MEYFIDQKMQNVTNVLGAKWKVWIKVHSKETFFWFQKHIALSFLTMGITENKM